MKVAVTGGSGQLGTLVLRRLAADREVTEIVAIDLRPPCVASKKIVAVTADVRDPEIGKHFTGCDALVHMAFVVTGPADGLFETVNVGGSRNVFDAAAAAGVKRIVYSSSVAAYGVVPGHPQPIVETTPRVFQPSFAYSSAKYRVEEFLDKFEPSHPDISIARIRPAILVGNHMEHALGDGLKRRTLVDLGSRNPMPIVWDEDVADAIVLALKKSARGAFNTAADEPLKIADLAKAGGLRLISPPRAVLKSVKLLIPWLSKLGIGRATDPAWLENTDVSMIMSCAKAKAELGWKPKCPTAAAVIRKYVETVPSRTDPRLQAFFRIIMFVSRRQAMPAEAQRMDTHMHLALTGPNGGDFDIRLNHGKLHVQPGVPRPPNVTVTMKAATFLDLIAGRTDYATAQLTGKIRVEGEALANLLVQGIIVGFRQQAKTQGVAGWPARRISAWMSKPAKA